MKSDPAAGTAGCEDPDIAECLRMIFDPDQNPPGLRIEDRSAEIATRF